MFFETKHISRYASVVLMMLVVNHSHINAQFRSTTWGMSSDEVKEVETISNEMIGELGQTVLVSNAKINGLETLVGYFFIDDKLYKARYMIKENYTNDNQYVDDYKSISAILSTKYGYKSIYYDWSDDLYKEDTSKYGFAVSLGHLMLGTNFEDEVTKIFHLLKGNDYKVSHFIDYSSLELISLEKELRRNKIMNDF